MFARSLVLLLVAVAATAQEPKPPAKYSPPPPVQPIPFSHRAHMSAGMACKNCHPVPEPGDFATIPETAKCMTCHATIKKESEAIRKLAEFQSQNKPVPWRRVYRIPDYVFFSHKEHLERAGATCETCHGPVRERDVMRKETDITMAGCMDCHRAKQASIACTYCHEQK